MVVVLNEDISITLKISVGIWVFANGQKHEGLFFFSLLPNSQLKHAGNIKTWAKEFSWKLGLICFGSL